MNIMYLRVLQLCALFISPHTEVSECELGTAYGTVVSAMSRADMKTLVITLTRYPKVINYGINGYSTVLSHAPDYIYAKLLLEYGADVNVRTDDGASPLHYAVSKENRILVDFLIQRGANVNARTESGRTPLQCATTGEVVELLMRAGADISALDDASPARPYPALKLLSGLFYAAVQSGAVAKVAFYLSSGVDFDMPNDTDKTSLVCAAEFAGTSQGGKKPWAEIAGLLLRRGAYVDAEIRQHLDMHMPQWKSVRNEYIDCTQAYLAPLSQDVSTFAQNNVLGCPREI